MKNAFKTRKTQYVPCSERLRYGNDQRSNVAFTENGAITNKSTMSDVLDWFGAGWSTASTHPTGHHQSFHPCLAEDRLTALKVLFYFRDVREGQGERNTFRILMNYLGQHYADVVRKNLENIPFYGRFDDLYLPRGHAP